MKLKALFNKYKYRIVFWVVYILLTIVIPSTQKKYYMESTVSDLDRSLVPIFLLILVGLLTVGLIYALPKANPFKWLLNYGLSSIGVCLFLFCTQGFVLGMALLVNRVYTTDTQQKMYTIHFANDSDHKPENMYLMNFKIHHHIDDDLLSNRVYYPGIKEDDTVYVTFRKGLLGIILPPAAK